MNVSAAISELRSLYGELAAQLERHRAENPKDERGIAVIAARRNGVGKAIEIVERHAKAGGTPVEKEAS